MLYGDSLIPWKMKSGGEDGRDKIRIRSGEETCGGEGGAIVEEFWGHSNAMGQRTDE